MRRVVVTGLGIISPIGNSAAEVDASLRAGKSGVEASAEMADRRDDPESSDNDAAHEQSP